MSFGNYDEEQHIPPLIPLKKAKAFQLPVVAPTEQSSSLNNDDIKNVLLESLKGTPTNQQASKDDKNSLPVKKQPNSQKIEQIQKKAKEKISTVQKKDNQSKNMQYQKAKQNEKNKFVIAQLLHSINIKNLSEQLYPVSNEALQKYLAGIQKQIQQLNIDAEKKQRTLAINQNNLHLKKELQTIRRQIDHCCLIKQLYYQKMNYRNKIQTLQEDISGLRTQNKELKIKVARGLQAIQNFKQNLPSDNEKQLRQKLNICTQELNQQKQMRQSLQRNIQSIINNFKRLYQQADIARQIVGKKLKDIEERQRKLRKMRENQEDQVSQEIVSPTRRVASLETAEKDKQILSSYSDFNKQYSQTALRKPAQQDFKKSTTLKPKTPVSYAKQRDQKDRKTQGINSSMTLQQKIKKMRANQTAVNRIKDN